MRTILQIQIQQKFVRHVAAISVRNWTNAKNSRMRRTERWSIVKSANLCGRCFGPHKFYRCQSNQK